MENRTAAILAALCALLAAMCLSIALAYRAANAEALCWRAFVEESEHPADGDCRRRSAWRF